MKLVESKGASNGFELPVAESCGVEDGEDDEEVSRLCLHAVFLASSIQKKKWKQLCCLQRSEEKEIVVPQGDHPGVCYFEQISK